MLFFENCCLCVPRRWGLLSIGYTRLLIVVLALCYILSTFGSQWDPEMEMTHTIMNWTVSAIFVVDLVFCGIFIKATTKRHLQLHKVFFYYSLVVVFLTLVTASVCIAWREATTNLIHSFTREIPYEGMVALIIAVIMIQSYLLLLIRSEILKIKQTQSWDPKKGRNVLM